MKNRHLPQDFDALQQRQKSKASNGERLKKRRKKNYTLHYILLFILTLVIGITLSVTVFFNVEIIEVEGNQRYNKEEIVASSGVQLGKNLFRINSGSAANMIIKEKKDIDSAVITKKLPNLIKISLVESSVAVVSVNDGKYYAISAGGRVISISDAKPENDVILLYGMKLPQISVGDFVKNIENKDSYVNFDKLTNAIASSGLTGISIIDISNEFQIKLYWKNRVEVNLGNMNDLEYKFDFATEIIENQVGADETGVLDVSQPRKGFYRIRPITLPNS